MDNVNFHITSELNKILICLQLYGNQSIYKKIKHFLPWEHDLLYNHVNSQPSQPSWTACPKVYNIDDMICMK